MGKTPHPNSSELEKTDWATSPEIEADRTAADESAPFDPGFDGFSSDEETHDVPDAVLTGDATQLLPPELLTLQAQLLSLGICTDLEWEHALDNAADRSSVQSILHALFELQQTQQNRHRGAPPPMSQFQIEYLVQNQGQALKLGHYVIYDVLDSDYLGTKYRAWNKNLGRIELIRCMRKEDWESSARQDLQAVFREVEAMAQLNHQNIIKVFHAGDDNGIPYIATEYVEGVLLSDVVEQATVPLDVEWASQKIRNIALALSHAHNHGVYHQQLTAEDVLVTDTGDVKILNLGLASLFDRSIRSREHLGADCHAHLAPEQWIKPNVLSPEADIYALGCLFYYLLTGTHAYKGETDEELMTNHLLAGIPTLERTDARRVNPILVQMLAKLPADRMSLKEVADSAQRIVTAQRTQWLDHSLFRSATAWLAGMTAVCVVLFVMSVPWSFPSTENSTPPWIDDYYTENKDVWLNPQSVQAFVTSLSPEEDPQQQLNLQSWQRRQQNWLTNFRSARTKAWPNVFSLASAVPQQPIVDEEMFEEWKERVYAVTTQRYAEIFDQAVEDFCESNPPPAHWRKVLQQEDRLAAAKDEIVDDASLTANLLWIDRIADEIRAPFRQVIPPDAMNTVEVYKELLSLPASARVDNMIEGRATYAAATTGHVAANETVNLEVRTRRAGYLTVLVFCDSKSHYLFQWKAPLQPGIQHSLARFISDDEKLARFVLFLTDEPIGSPFEGKMRTMIHEVEQVTALEQSFKSPRLYEQIRSHLRNDTPYPSLQPASDKKWFSRAFVDVRWD